MAAIASIPSPLLCHRSPRGGRRCPSPSLRLTTSLAPPLRSRSAARGRVAAPRAVAEDQTLAPAADEESPAPEPSVSVPVPPSDMLTMFFKAEGTMDESAISKVSKALEEIEGVSDLNVQIAEGIASVELTKETTVQATGVASNLVEIIHGSGFKLQTLNLSFKDEEDVIR